MLHGPPMGLDTLVALRSWRIWTRWAWLETKRRYSRTMIGPFWITINLGILVIGFGFVFGALFGADIRTFIPHVALGLVAWAFISGVISEGCSAFVANATVIKSISLPPTVYALRLIARQGIGLVHNCIIVVAVIVLFPVEFGAPAVYFLPALLIYMVNAYWIILFTGIMGARYRDFTQIVVALLQVIFMFTPVFWQKEFLGTNTFITDWNPFFHFVEIFRAPLLGQVPAWESYAVTGLVTLVGYCAMFVLYRRGAGRVAYWV